MAWSQEQLANARIIYNVGIEVGASLRDIQAALMAAIVESGLRNLNYGDRDSIGLFQQRDAWGTTAARLNPYTAAKMFFTGGNGGQPGLLDIGNRSQLGLGELAQAVQVSAYPDRYAQHEADAQKLLGSVENATGTPGKLGEIVNPADPANLPKLDAVATPTVPEVNGIGEVTADQAGIGALTFGRDGIPSNSADSSPVNALSFGMQLAPENDPMAKVLAPSLDQLGLPGADVAAGWRGQVVAAARKMLGTPYVWGGTSYSGVDCSGLIALLYNNRGFNLPRLSADQARSGTRVDLKALKPGDLVAWNNSSRNNGADHIAIFIGNGQIIEAPRPGGVVQISNIYDTANAWGVALHR